jgi:quercetin dioxygenase-like cupin family protein
MTDPRAVHRNWRDSDSYLGHDNAIVWPVFMPPAEDDSRPHRCLTHLNGFAGHSLQGGKSTDYHAHANAEQYYYILSGNAEVRIEDSYYPVQEGSVAYFPPGVHHQLIGKDNPDWMQYLIITCPASEDMLAEGQPRSEPRVLNWRDSSPEMGNFGKAVTWQLLERLDKNNPSTEQPCLLAFWYLARGSLSKGHASAYHQHDDKEQIYYVLEGEGSLVAGADAFHVREGDTVYLPRGVAHMILNDRHQDWLSYLVVS